MPGYERPDVYIIEQLSQSAPNLFPTVTPAAFVGYSRQGPTVPRLINSWPQFQQLYGGWTGTADDKLAEQVYQYFNNSGSVCWVVRADGAGSIAAHLTLADREGTPEDTLVVSAANPGAWGNTIFIEVVDTGVTGRFNLNIRRGTATSAPIERFTDVSMDPVDARNVIDVVNSSTTGSNYVTLSTPNGWAYAGVTSIPAASTVGSGGLPLTGGADATAQPTLGAAGQVIASLGTLSQGLSGQRGLVINLVGVTDVATINAALAYVQNRGDSFLVIDPVVGQDSEAITATRQGYSGLSYGAVYWPNVWIGDPSSTQPGKLKLVSPSGSVMGKFALTDATRGVSKAPAGTNTSLAGVVGLEVPAPTPSDYDIVASGNVNAIRYFQGIGFCIWGSKTLKATDADSQISVRRTLMQVEAAIRQVTLFGVEEDNDDTLWYEITQNVSAVLQQIWQLRGLKGRTPQEAYFVICDASNNTPQSISAGEVHVRVGVALQTPAQFIVIEVGQFAGTAPTISESLTA